MGSQCQIEPLNKNQATLNVHSSDNSPTGRDGV